MSLQLPRPCPAQAVRHPQAALPRLGCFIPAGVSVSQAASLAARHNTPSPSALIGSLGPLGTWWWGWGGGDILRRVLCSHRDRFGWEKGWESGTAAPGSDGAERGGGFAVSFLRRGGRNGGNRRRRRVRGGERRVFRARKKQPFMLPSSETWAGWRVGQRGT